MPRNLFLTTYLRPSCSSASGRQSRPRTTSDASVICPAAIPASADSRNVNVSPASVCDREISSRFAASDFPLCPVQGLSLLQRHLHGNVICIDRPTEILCIGKRQLRKNSAFRIILCKNIKYLLTW
jgi:hypothetical protein